MWPETRREKEALDRHITGNYGEDMYQDDEEEPRKYNDWRGQCPNCKNNLTSDDMPFYDTCPYCGSNIPFK